MIGKKEWFTRRKYTGWGLTPSTWQGWVYTAVMVAPLVVMSFLQVNETVLAVIIVWFIIFAVDITDIMIHVPKDERDALHEAIAERNALWAMIAVLTAGVGYQAATTIAEGKDAWVDPVILVALAGALIAKAATNWYLDKHD
jgi:UDP-N-acetylmuramyl pentapeptide phosphotransferase/UDP-N-acetylglucosamine-1-phosphate transferase